MKLISKLKKMNNQKGMSIMYALMYLLILTTVGGLVLTAASSATGVLSRNRASQQNYFLVRSAAELISSELEGASVIISYKEEFILTQEIKKDPLTEIESSIEESFGPYYMGDMSYSSTGGKKSTGIKFADKADIKNEIQAIYNSQMSQSADYFSKKSKPTGTPSSESNPIELSFQSEWNGEQKKVNGTVSILGNYSLSIKLWAETSEGDSYSIMMVVPANVSEFDGDTTVTVTGDSGENWSKRETSYLTPKNTMIKWNKATIVKGY